MIKHSGYLMLIALSIAACNDHAAPSTPSSSALTPEVPSPDLSPDQPDDEFGLRFLPEAASEDLGDSTSAEIFQSSSGTSITYKVSHVSGCGYQPHKPRYSLQGDTLELSYALWTQLEALPASPCVYRSSFHFDRDPAAKRVTFNVRSD